jgi:hypothetical protein
MGDGRSAFGAENAVNIFARATLASPALGGTIHRELSLRNDHHKGFQFQFGLAHLRHSKRVCTDKKGGGEGKLTVGRSGLALTVIAMVVASKEWLVNVNAVRNSLAKAVSSKNHVY